MRPRVKVSGVSPENPVRRDAPAAAWQPPDGDAYAPRTSRKPWPQCGFRKLDSTLSCKRYRGETESAMADPKKRRRYNLSHEERIIIGSWAYENRPEIPPALHGSWLLVAGVCYLGLLALARREDEPSGRMT
jgi:hypothetical protein